MALSPRLRYGLIAGVLLGIAVLAALPFLMPERERSPDLVPVPIEPFGMIRRPELVFRWAMPQDGAPVRVEVLSTEREPVWSSTPRTGGELEPSADVLKTLPAGDLLWRPRAVPADGAERPGDLAAFTLTR